MALETSAGTGTYLPRRLDRMDAVAAQRALARLRETLAAHETGEGVLFDSRAWIVSARRAPT